jgi:AraC family transcriptional regulator
MSSKYGVSFTHAAWRGWPLRVGQFARRGLLHDLVAATDAVLLWSGGVSEVTLHERRERSVVRHAFVRRAGMVDLLPRGTALEEVSWQGQASECISVSLGDAQLGERLGAAQPLAIPGHLRLGLVDAHVVDLVQRLGAQAVAGQPWGALYVESLSLALASYIHSRYSASSVTAENRAGTLPVQSLIAFVEENLGSNIGLVELAAVAGYSPNHFARLFKQAFASSPHQYVLERRIERAKSILRDPHRSLAQVALECGFGSQAHFNTAFKAKVGVTPGVYRKG